MSDEDIGLACRRKFAGAGLSETLREDRAKAKSARKKSRQIGKPAAKTFFGGHRATQGRWASASDPVTDNSEPETPEQMSVRLYRAFAGQVDQLEVRLRDLLEERSISGLAEIDKTVKTLASLAKTLSALMELKEDAARNDQEESGLDDPDALRSELAQRLAGLCQGGPG